MAKSETGVWIDDATGELTTSRPKTGTQIVAPGGEISGAAKTRLAAYGLDASSIEGFDETEEAKVVTPVETADADDSDVETADEAKPVAKKAAASKKK